jgi:hypothetical protein
VLLSAPPLQLGSVAAAGATEAKENLLPMVEAALEPLKRLCKVLILLLVVMLDMNTGGFANWTCGREERSPHRSL